MRIWDIGAGKDRLRLKESPGSIQQFAFSLDGRLMAGAAPNFPLRLWDAATGQKLHETARLDGQSSFIAYSPDSRMLATPGSASRDEESTEVWLWETVSGAERCRLRGHERGVCAAAFSPDGRLMATASRGEESMHFWDAVTGAEGRRLTGHRGCVWTLAFSPDGKQLASGGPDTTVLIWDVPALVPARPRPSDELSAAQLNDLWAALAGADGTKAYQAIATLANHPGQAGPFLRDALKPFLAADGKDMARLIADLDADDVQVREKASRELADLGRPAEGALKRALDGQPSAEVERRVRALLEKLGDKEPPPDRLRGLRATDALERMGTGPAREALEALAEGGTDYPLSRDAKASLERLAKRGRAVP
jgi:hypothetical protein